MKSFKDTLILLTIVFSALFLVNTGLLYAGFGINALNPVHRQAVTGSKAAAEESRPPARTETALGEAGQDGNASAVPQESGGGASAPAPSDATGVLSAGDGMYMTAEEVQSLDGLSLQDKLSALAVLSEVGSTESDRIYELASDGVTYAEMEEIKGILEKKLSQADMNLLYGILDRSRRLYAEKAPGR